MARAAAVRLLISGGSARDFWSLWGLVCLLSSLTSPFWKVEGYLGFDEIGANMFCGIIALPAVLAHSELIRIPAMIMSIVGGLLIYGTITSFGMFFQEEQEF